MKNMLGLFKDEDGATAVEYAVMLGLILMACIASIYLVGQQTGNSLGNSSSEIQEAFDHVR